MIVRMTVLLPPPYRGRLAILLMLLCCLSASWLMADAAWAGNRHPEYVGSANCVACHQAQGARWATSHHAQSMQVASAKSVLGDFNHAEVNHHGQSTRFFRRGAQFWVNTAGRDGKNRDFQILYTFGIHPLQQYLIAMPGGRLQALGVAWDARPKAQGGQRWYHLYADAPPAPGEPTHWSGRDQNWNFMCASCHSTNVQKNYDLASDSFNTRWSALNVGCEACHGPGSVHVAWAKGGRRQGGPGLGLPQATMAARRNYFAFSAPSAKIAALNGDLAAAQSANEVCYGCHSRRQELVTDRSKEPGGRFLDHYLPSLIEKNNYHPDGQIDGEVFEATSYLQSAMHHAGVTCSNCHEVHSLKLRATGNALCFQCHQAEHYGATTHHRHSSGSAGAACVNCHMPSKIYMGVHERRDHSLRIPRPDISLLTGVPNACNQCHTDKSAAWAAQALADKEAGSTSRFAAASTFAELLTAIWEGAEVNDRLLAAIRSNTSGVVKASLLSQVAAAGLVIDPAVLQGAALSHDALVRLGAARALATQSIPAAWQIGAPLLADPLRAVRIEAARALASRPAPPFLPLATRNSLQTALDELIAAELASADRPEAHVNLAAIYLGQGRAAQAEKALRTALRLENDFVPALVNLADLYRTQQREREAEALLRSAVLSAPEAAEPAHALGLLYVRQGQLEEALHWLGQAAALAPKNTRYVYILNLAKEKAAAQRR